jgi:hypothetical protein
VSRDVTGYDDLDEYGSWSSEPEYGYVWTPTRVIVGWSPYRYGRWVWVSPWGWTWIDDAPWGYAPFHYGRWAHIRNRWCWVPGPRHVRAVYAPALVGWAGSHGSHLSWFPLGPREVYVPGRRFSRHYVERVNIANTIVAQARIREMYERRGPAPSYRNRAVPDAITSVARETFTSAQRTGSRRVRLDPRELNASAGTVAPPRIAPVRDSRLGGVARMNPRLRPDLASRQVIVKRDPPPASARFARRPQTSPADVAQMPPSRTGRPQVRDERDSFGSRSDDGRGNRPHDQDRSSFQERLGERVVGRNRGEREDRPPRNEQRPMMDDDARANDPRNGAPNDDGNRWQRRDQERPHREDRPDRDRDSQYPQYSQRPQRTQDAVREAVARQIEQRERQQRERDEQRDEPRAGFRPEQRFEPRQEQSRAERREMEHPRQDYRPAPRQEQPRQQEYRQPRQESQPRPQPQQQQPRQERSEPRPPPRGRPDGRNSKE